jgi:predicted MFS family arabinose efflux permease
MLLRRFDTFAVMRIGGGVAGIALLVIGYSFEWQLTALAFAVLGFGFYKMHTSLQAQATELSPTARGSAMALHACSFFTGIASGAPLFGLAYLLMGPGATSVVAGVICTLTGILAARALAARTTPPS